MLKVLNGSPLSELLATPLQFLGGPRSPWPRFISVPEYFNELHKANVIRLEFQCIEPSNMAAIDFIFEQQMLDPVFF